MTTSVGNEASRREQCVFIRGIQSVWRALAHELPIMKHNRGRRTRRYAENPFDHGRRRLYLRSDGALRAGLNQVDEHMKLGHVRRHRNSMEPTRSARRPAVNVRWPTSACMRVNPAAHE